MAERARQLQPEIEQHEQQQQKPRKKVKVKKGITRFEKGFILTLIAVVVAFAIMMLNKQTEIHTVRAEISEYEKQITEVKKINETLNVQVAELSTYERLVEKAKELGLTLNENNVKVVPNK